MKKRNYVIIFLFIMVILGVIIFKIYPNPKISELTNTNILDATTQDFSVLLPYKSKYMGNNSSIININNNLPLSEIKKSFYLNPDTLTLEINYAEASKNINYKKLKQCIVYNSTSNFVLIDNLQTIKINFTDKTFTLSRNSLEKWYGKNLLEFQNVNNFKSQVQNKLNDENYVDKFMQEVVDK
jgi:hypothetical protein